MFFLVLCCTTLFFGFYPQSISAQQHNEEESGCRIYLDTDLMTQLAKVLLKKQQSQSPAPSKVCPSCNHKEHLIAFLTPPTCHTCAIHKRLQPLLEGCCELYFDPLVLTELANHLLKVGKGDQVSPSTCCPKCSEYCDPSKQRACKSCSLYELAQLSLGKIVYAPGTDILWSAIQNHFNYTIYRLLTKHEYGISRTLSWRTPDAPSALILAARYNTPWYLKKFMFKQYENAITQPSPKLYTNSALNILDYLLFKKHSET